MAVERNALGTDWEGDHQPVQNISSNRTPHSKLAHKIDKINKNKEQVLSQQENHMKHTKNIREEFRNIKKDLTQ